MGGQSLVAGAWVAPTLFYAQSDRHLAGFLAGRLFSLETYVGLAVAVLALLLPGRSRFVWGYLAAAMLSINEWVLSGSWRRLTPTAPPRADLRRLARRVGRALPADLSRVLRLVWNEDFR